MSLDYDYPEHAPTREDLEQQEAELHDEAADKWLSQRRGSARDPFTDPAPGDQFVKLVSTERARRYYKRCVTRLTEGFGGLWVVYRTPRGLDRTCPLGTWRKWAKGATYES